MFINSNNETLTYKDLKNSYPVHNEIPFFLNNNEYHELAFQVNLYLLNEQINIKSIQSSNIPYKTTRKRIENYKDAKLKTLKKITQSLGEFYKDLQLKQVPRSSFNAYLELFFKDWLWNQTDNLSYLNDIPTDKDDILFLGCGAARVAYEYAKNNKNCAVYATDKNPINLCLLNNQKNTKIYDTIKNPNTLTNTSVKFEFNSPDSLDNFHPFIADFYSMKTKPFKHVVSNWFLDILPHSIESNLSHLLTFMDENSSFTYIGLSNFYNKSLEQSYTKEELEEILNVYFKDVSIETRSFNYLENEYTSQKRKENILIANCKEPLLEQARKYELNNLEIQYNQSVAAKKMEYITYARFLNHVDGNLSFKNSCDVLTKEFGFSAEEAQHYAKVMIEKINS